MKRVGVECQRGIEHRFDGATQNAPIRTRHADIALKGRTARKNLFVRSWDMGVRPQDGGCLSI